MGVASASGDGFPDGRCVAIEDERVLLSFIRPEPPESFNGFVVNRSFPQPTEWLPFRGSRRGLTEVRTTIT